MNKRTITVQAPLRIPKPPSGKGRYFLFVFGTDSGFAFRWVRLKDCPMFIRPKTSQKARLVMSMTNQMSDLPTHGKIVLTFEEMLACEDNKTIYHTWKPGEWFPYLQGKQTPYKLAKQPRR